MKKSFTVKKIVRLVCGGGLLGLISLSLVGVGFSSWLINSKDNPSNDASLDHIDADGDFSDINNYLSLTKRESGDFVWNNKLKCFQAPNNEIIDGYQGKLYLYFSVNTGDDPIKDHLPSSQNTRKIVSDIALDTSFNPSANDQKKALAFSSSIADAKLIASSSPINGTEGFDKNPTATGNKENGSWKETFSISYGSLSGIETSNVYYFAVRYLFTANDSLDFFSSNRAFLASVSREF